MGPHYTYIIQSEKDLSYYIGSSKDPEKRLVKHNKPHKGYTARKQPWKLVYTEEYDSKSEAFKRENFLKNQRSREFIVRLIEKKCSSVG